MPPRANGILQDPIGEGPALLRKMIHHLASRIAEEPRGTGNPILRHRALELRTALRWFGLPGQETATLHDCEFRFVMALLYAARRENR